MKDLVQRRRLQGAWRPFYPLLLNSILATSLVALRVWVSGSFWYVFLVWNLALAWVPYVASLWADAQYRRGGRFRLLVPGLAWLLFLPNAPYLVSDFIHLRLSQPIPVWYDALLLMSFAWSGCLLGIASLQTMQRIVAELTRPWLSWLFVALSALLSGFGVYMGRFLRWNSWDLLTSPGDILGDVQANLLSSRTLTVTLLFSSLMFVCYVTALSLSQFSHEH